MPHSSGGGHSGGGFHGGGGFHSSGSHSTSSNRPAIHYSRRPFFGAFHYVYYDRYYRPHSIYTNAHAGSAVGRVQLASLFILGVFFLIPLIIMIIGGIHTPKPLKTNYDTTIVIRDETNVLSDNEEEALVETFHTFYEKTGITPAFMSVEGVRESRLENYAYVEYIKDFSDEKHWLIMYSTYPNSSEPQKTEWAFEGMQGNDTDIILHSKVLDKFNETVYNGLSDDNISVFTAFNDAFNMITPHIMDTYFEMDNSFLMVGIIWMVIVGISLGFQIYTYIQQSKIKNATKAPEDSVLTNCPYCDSPYYTGTITRCPKCGAVLDDDGNATKNTKKSEPKIEEPEFEDYNPDF